MILSLQFLLQPWPRAASTIFQEGVAGMNQWACIFRDLRALVTLAQYSGATVRE